MCRALFFTNKVIRGLKFSRLTISMSKHVLHLASGREQDSVEEGNGGKGRAHALVKTANALRLKLCMPPRMTSVAEGLDDRVEMIYACVMKGQCGPLYLKL